MSKFGFKLIMRGTTYGGWGAYGLQSHTIYPTREAAEAVKPTELSHYDRRYDYNPMFDIVELTWKDVAARKLENGTWSKPIWEERNRLNGIPDHFAHVSEGDTKLIAFVENDQKGEADRWTAMKPGRYLKRFFPDLLASEVEFWATWFEKGQRPDIDLGIELQFAYTAEEIERVYEEGPDSCMQGKKAVIGYAGGDLAIAYYVYDGEIIARCLSWPEKKVYGCIYTAVSNLMPGDMGADEFQEWMEARFLTLGWKCIYSDDKLFNGARLATHPIPHNSGMIYMPYFDHFGAVWDEKRQCLIAHSYDRSLINLGCGGTGGAMAFAMARCCIARKFVPSNTVVTVFNTITPQRSCTMSQDAAATRAWQCAGGGEWFANRLKPVVIDNMKYSRKFVKRNMVTCCVSGKTGFRSSMYRCGDDKYCHFDHRGDPKYFFYSEYFGLYFLLGDESKKFPGWPASYDNDRTLSANTREYYGRKVAA